MTRKAGRGISHALAIALGAATAVPMVAFAEEKPSAPVKVERAHEYSVTATVVSTDPPQRTVKLKFPAGDTREFTVQKDVDLTKVKQGDKVKMDFVVSIALSIQRPGEAAAPDLKVEEARKRMPDGVDLGRQITATAKITAIDAKAKTITVLGPEGNSDTLDVESAEGQAAMKNLKVGDEITVVYSRAVAIRLVPTTGK